MSEQIGIPVKIYSIYVYDKHYDVYRIEGKKHDPHTDDNRWIYFTTPLEGGLIPPADSPYWEPMTDHISRSVWEIKFKQITTTKEKWSETRFNGHTNCEMWCNGILMYEFGTTGGDSGMKFAMAKAQYLQVILGEHIYNFWDPESNEGRKIYWKGLPATVKVKSHGWEIAIIPDYTCGLVKEEWWKELKRRETKIGGSEPVDQDEVESDAEDTNEAMRDDYINWGDALSDQHIDWFRK